MHTALKLAFLIAGLTGSLIASSPAHAGTVRECPPQTYPGYHEVALFQHAFYGGRCFIVTIEPSEDFLMASVSAYGIPNDSISSVVTGSNVEVEMYQHANFQGIYIGMRGDSAIPQLSAYNFNDRLSSMKVMSSD